MRRAAPRLLIVIAATGIVGALAGCTSRNSPEKVEAMAIPADLAYEPARAAFSHAVTIGAITGGSDEANQDGITGDEFRDALRASLYANQLLANPTSARYRIDADINFHIVPWQMFQKQVDTQAHYKLISLPTGKAVFDKEIASSFTEKDKMREAMGPVGTIMFSALFLSRMDNAERLSEIASNAYAQSARENLKSFLGNLANWQPDPSVPVMSPTEREAHDLVRCEHHDGSVQMRERAACFGSGGTVTERVQ